MCTAGGSPTSALASSSDSACATGSQRIRACTVGIADSATTATTPPSPRSRTSAAAAIQRRSASSAARRSCRPSSAQPSSSSAAPYPPDTRGSAPGVATTSAGSAGTSVITASPPDVMTVVPGNARPNSSAVRRAPTTTARTASEPHRTQRSDGSARPHHRHTAPAVSRSGSDIGPVQWRQRAMVRHLPHASAGTYPRRGTWTSTGRSAASAVRAASSAIDGNRAVYAAASRSCAKPLSSIAVTRGVRARTTERVATRSCAQPLRTSAWASAVRA